MAAKRSTDPKSSTDYKASGTKSEISAFKKGLLGVSIDTIREQLDSKAISRKWKRELAVAELERREDEESEFEDDDAVPGEIRGTRMQTRRWGGWTAGAIIAGCSLIILYTMYELWSG